LHALVLLLGMALFTAVAYCDVRTRRIPNTLAIAIAALGLVQLILTGDLTAALYTLGAAAAVFVATFLLFWRRFLGGGDVKLMAATALLVGYHDLLAFLFVMSVCGALVAVAVLARDRFGLLPTGSPMTMPAQEQDESSARLTIPYGLAIAAAGVLTLFLQSYPLR
jgi:prepilin peptidase CpaA